MFTFALDACESGTKQPLSPVVVLPHPDNPCKGKCPCAHVVFAASLQRAFLDIRTILNSVAWMQDNPVART